MPAPGWSDGQSSTGVGVFGEASTNGYNFGVVGSGPNAGVAAFNAKNQNAAYLASVCCAGWFTGSVHVTGKLTKGGGGFLIDDPLDPPGRYLAHSFVESSEMKNVYDGVVILNDSGEAIINLPRWVEKSPTIVSQSVAAIQERRSAGN